MDTRKLKHFIALYEHGSFHRAAEAVHLSQSALSRSIQALEEELGVSLFDRSGNRSKITPAGTVLLGNARRLLFDTHELMRELALFRDGDLGSIALGFSPTPASVFLAPCLAEISRKRPGLRLDTWIGRTPELIDAVRSEKYDLALIDASAIDNPDGLIAGQAGQMLDDQPVRVVDGAGVEHLASLPGGFLVRADHPLLTEATCNLAAIRRFPVACSPISGDLARRMVEHFGPDGHPARLITYFCDSYHVLRDVVLSSDTVVMSVHATMRADIDAGRLIRLKFTGPQLLGHYAMVRLAGRSVSPALAELCQQAREHFAEQAGML